MKVYNNIGAGIRLICLYLLLLSGCGEDWGLAKIPLIKPEAIYSSSGGIWFTRLDIAKGNNVVDSVGLYKKTIIWYCSFGLNSKGEMYHWFQYDVELKRGKRFKTKAELQQSLMKDNISTVRLYSPQDVWEKRKENDTWPSDWLEFQK